MNNYNYPSQLVIIGGGTSIKEGIKKDLWNRLNNKFIIGLNYSFKFFPNPTFQCYVDHPFYLKQIENMKYLPLIIGNPFPPQKDSRKKEAIKKATNTVFIPNSCEYHRNVLKGCYKASLCGLYGLSLAIHLLDIGEIYLLGYDFGELRTKDFDKFLNYHELQQIIVKDKRNRPMTHFYQGEIQHRGIGKINYFTARNKAEEDFKVYKDEKQIKIYNVSKVSKINVFPKIDYDTFFKKLNKIKYNQDELRIEIKKRLQ